jgi:hypothetical protein
MQGSMPPTTITPQNKLPLFLFCVFVALAIVVIFFYLTRPKTNTSEIIPTRIPISPANVESPTPEATTSANTQSNSDLPPLYPGVEWKPSQNREILFIDDQGNPTKKNGISATSNSTTSIPQEALGYFKSQLESKLWKLTDTSGGVDGELFDYEKNGRFFRYGYKENGGDKKDYYLLVEYSN